MKVLVHVCCGPCAGGVVERLINEGNKIDLFFYNPNIYPKDEYAKRLDSARILAEYFKLDLIEPFDISDWNHEHRLWKHKIEGLESLPEGRARCFVCYAIRLRKTAEYAKINDYDAITSTLIMGPMKDYNKIVKIGKTIASEYDLKYISDNFRKKGGQIRSIELSKQLKLYRQNYCGCEFSIR